MFLTTQIDCFEWLKDLFLSFHIIQNKVKGASLHTNLRFSCMKLLCQQLSKGETQELLNRENARDHQLEHS